MTTTAAEMVRCIRLNLDCADVCATTGRVLSRRTTAEPELIRAVPTARARACRTCGAECARHGEAGMRHCAVCAGSCRRCEQACEQLLAALS
ncbi:MAG TPA: hypothetical protein VM367_03485 [Pseudonocardia sp.]|jgi:hypothetical protein|nr:hypothetical protein [Pseudonocardia sp.]